MSGYRNRSYCFDTELSLTIAQLGTVFSRRVIDRTQLILDIFAQRARSRRQDSSRAGPAQIFAPASYRPGIELSRLGGTIGNRGRGDKTGIRSQTDTASHSNIGKEHKTNKRAPKIQRLKRQRSPIPIVSLVGYTNAENPPSLKL